MEDLNMETTSDIMATELNDLTEKKRALVSTIKQYLREHGGKVEMPDDWQDEERELEHTSMAVMNDTESFVDAYIEGVSMTGEFDSLTIWGSRTDGQGYTGFALFDAQSNAEDVATWLLRMEEMTEEKMQ